MRRDEAQILCFIVLVTDLLAIVFDLREFITVNVYLRYTQLSYLNK